MDTKRKTIRIAVSAGLAATLAIAVAAPSAYARPPAPGPLPAAVADLHDLGVTGVQGLTQTRGRLSTARAGVADVDTGAPVPVDGYFRMGSNTKTFVAVVVLQLVGEGRLSLDDTVERWLPGLVPASITVRQLLQHQSGLPNYTDDLPELQSKEAFLAGRLEHHDAADLVALAMRHPLVFPPGTSWQYSNTNYIVAGLLVRRVTGHGWATEVDRRIFGPLGLRHTYYPGDTATLRRPFARGYQQFEPGGELTDTTEFNPTAADAAGSLVTTPSDLARFWRALQGGRLLRPAQMTQMHTTVEAGRPDRRYGLGIMWIRDSCGGYWGHGGDVPGTQTRNAVNDDGSRVVVLALTTQFADDTSGLVGERATRLIEDTLC